jgi:predicted adenylyl cyclase CyaB
MPRNVEIKAMVRDWTAVQAAAARLAAEPPQRLVQWDTFFHVPRGRLKLREFSPQQGELIYYERPDAREAKTSHYQIAPTSQPQPLREVLAAALGVRGEVKKERWLYLVGQTRIHLDRVEHLGEFLELEVVLTEDQTSEDGQRIAQEVQTHLGVREEDLLEGAYLDLKAKG